MTKLYVIIRTLSVKQTKPKLEISDIIRRRPFVELPIPEVGSPYFYYHAYVTHPTDSEEQYYIRLRWLNNGQLSEPQVVAADNDIVAAANHMETDVVNFLTQENISLPLFRKYDNDGAVSTVSGVRTSRGENVWWEIMEIEMPVVGGENQEVEEGANGYMDDYINERTRDGAPKAARELSGDVTPYADENVQEEQ